MRHRPRPHHVAAIVLSGVWLCEVVTCAADEPVTAELAGGRVILGHVDPHTDTQHLWLHRTEPGIQLSSGFAWSQVLRMTQGSRSATGSELLPFAQQLATARSELENASPIAREADRSRVVPHHRSSEESARTPPVRSPVKYLRVHAQLGQWDRDVQPDGLQIFVSPFDAMNRLVAVQGHIEFILVGEIERINGGQHGPLRPVFKELERATQLVRWDQFSAGPAVYQLPFSRVHPDFDADIAGQALLTVCLTVPGQGVFEASDANVSLREYSRIRDQLQFYTDRRYWPLESGGRPNR